MPARPMPSTAQGRYVAHRVGDRPWEMRQHGERAVMAHHPAVQGVDAERAGDSADDRQKQQARCHVHPPSLGRQLHSGRSCQPARGPPSMCSQITNRCVHHCCKVSEQESLLAMNEALPRVREARDRALDLHAKAMALETEVSALRQPLVTRLLVDATLTYDQLVSLDRAIEKWDGHDPPAGGLGALIDQVVAILDDIERHLQRLRADQPRTP